MESLNDAERGGWLRPLLDSRATDMHCVVPHGYPAYARVFHPGIRDRPADTGSWRRRDRTALLDVDSESVSWSAVAGTFGMTLHALAQYQRLLGPAAGPYGEVLDAEGWRYFEPRQGSLEPKELAAVASVLCRHSSTPGEGVAAIWEGWGGLTSSAGSGELTSGTDSPGGRESARIAVDDVPGSGVLPASVVNDMQLELPGRNHFLFSAAPAGFTDPAWIGNAPWHRDPQWPQSPSLLWPDDRAWVLVTEIDFDSTIVAGSSALVADLVSDPGVEALGISEGSSLAWDARR